jgi:glycerol-3-phosphate dehydrogenase
VEEPFEMKPNIIIIGAGIIGTAIARALSRYNVVVTLLERASDIAFKGSTKANTGLIHAGYDDDPGTLKAKLCVQGNKLWPHQAHELRIPLLMTGSLVVALQEEEVPLLKELKRRGEQNGVPHLNLIEDKERLLRMEPALTKETIAALFAPTAGVTSPYEAAFALAENAHQNGVHVRCETEVEDITLEGDSVQGVQTSRGFLQGDYVINAAGLFSDKISAMVGIDHFVITPIKGEYLLFDKAVKDFINHVIFPVPSAVSKGIVITHTVHGNLLLGPNANTIHVKEDVSTTKAGLDEVMEAAQKLTPALTSIRDMIITNFAGLRAESNTGDFILESYDEVPGFINAAGIKSPGLTAAPALAEMVVTLLREQDLELEEKENFIPYREPIHQAIEGLPSIEKLWNRNPRYGHIICRCEQVSEGEVIEAITRGGNTLDGIKFRTRAGMGRCQGGFCTPHLLRILARERGIKVEEITKRGGQSQIVPCKVKTLLEEADTT